MEMSLFGSSAWEQLETTYYLLAEESEEGRMQYGILVRCGEEEARIRDLSSSRESVLVLLEQMKRGFVTPATARDVAEDWLLA